MGGGRERGRRRERPGEEGDRRDEGEEDVRSQEGRAAALGASNPACKLRGLNGRQLAGLSTVFLAFPEEGEQSVCAGRGWLAAAGPLPAPGRGSQTGDRCGWPVRSEALAGRARVRPGATERGLGAGEGETRRAARPRGRRPGPPRARVNRLLVFCSVLRQILGGFPQLHGHGPYGLPGRGERYVG